MEDQSEKINISSEIKQLFESDQKDRQNFSNGLAKGLEISQRDEQRLKIVKEIVTQGGISDPHELNMLAYIFQHGNTIDDYKQALSLTIQAVEAGLSPKDSLIPQATDRLMIQEQLDNSIPLNKLKQKYGTQTMFDETGKPIKPPTDETITQEEFEKFGIEQ